MNIGMFAWIGSFDYPDAFEFLDMDTFDMNERKCIAPKSLGPRPQP